MNLLNPIWRFGIGFLNIFVFIASLFLIIPPFDNLIPIAFGLWSIIGSITLSIALICFLSIKIPPIRQSYLIKMKLYSIIFLISTIITASSLPALFSIDFDYWIIRDNGPVFRFAIHLLFIVILIYHLIFTAIYFKKSNLKTDEIQLEMEKTSKTLHITQLKGLMCLLVIGGSTFGYFFATETPKDYSGCHEKSLYYYSNLTGSHYNNKLDLIDLGDQQILIALENSLRAFTQLRQPCGGFPMYSTEDFCEFYGDGGRLYPNEIDFQLGTPQAGALYLRMYQLEPNPIYLQLARSAGDATIGAQDREDGGWYKYAIFDEQNQSIQPYARNWRRHASYDDDTMQGTMRFLLTLYNVTKDVKYLNSINLGFDHLKRHQYTNGPWPQETNFIYPYYSIYPTLNDGLLEDMFDLYMKAIQILPERTEEFRIIIDKVFSWLISVQGKSENITQAGAWAQQYNFEDDPCWARAFEPPSFEASGTAGMVKKFIQLSCYFSDSKYLSPIPAAISWLNISRINYTENGVQKSGWSRLYELNTNIPIFGLADGGPNKNPQYSYTPVRGGYVWYGTWGLEAIEDWTDLQNMEYNLTKFSINENQPESISNLYANAVEAAESMNSDGFWIDSNKRIHIKEFVSNAQDLIEYLSRIVD